MDKPLKDAPLSIRIPTDTKNGLVEEADRLHISVSQFTETILEEYIKAKNQHGRRLVWPPEFVYFIHDETNQDPNAPE